MFSFSSTCGTLKRLVIILNIYICIEYVCVCQLFMLLTLKKCKHLNIFIECVRYEKSTISNKFNQQQYNFLPTLIHT